MRTQLTSKGKRFFAPIFAASLVLALAFTLSCSSDDGGGNEPSSNSGTGISSSGNSSSGGLSSSDGTSSSSEEADGCTATDNTDTQYCSNCNMKTYGSVTDVDGNAYKTVEIGIHTWMAENLNYEASGSVCYNSDDANCDKYGRLYDWPMAMDLPSSCKTNSCASQVSEEHQGICPSGWHIPSEADWNALVTAVGGKETAGTKLKAISGWNDDDGQSGNGSDSYGFSGLPGGGRYQSVSDFSDAGKVGQWWSASETNSVVYTATLYHSLNKFGLNGGTKSHMYSVRCLKNSSVSLSSSSAGSSSSNGNVSVPHGSETYETILIGTQTWLKRNLNYVPSETDIAANSWCYGNQNDNCTKYGRLYDWATAMALPSKCNSTSTSNADCTVETPRQGICPAGYHIPTNADWDKLLRYVDGNTTGTSSLYDSPTAGKYLKAADGWNSYSGKSGNGEDKYGFSALPGGNGSSDGTESNFFDAGNDGMWWSADENNSSGAYFRGMSKTDGEVYWSFSVKSTSYSVRCLKDD